MKIKNSSGKIKKFAILRTGCLLKSLKSQIPKADIFMVCKGARSTSYRWKKTVSPSLGKHCKLIQVEKLASESTLLATLRASYIGLKVEGSSVAKGLGYSELSYGRIHRCSISSGWRLNWALKPLELQSGCSNECKTLASGGHRKAKSLSVIRWSQTNYRPLAGHYRQCLKNTTSVEKPLQSAAEKPKTKHLIKRAVQTTWTNVNLTNPIPKTAMSRFLFNAKSEKLFCKHSKNRMSKTPDFDMYPMEHIFLLSLSLSTESNITPSHSTQTCKQCIDNAFDNALHMFLTEWTHLKLIKNFKLVKIKYDEE